MSSLTSNTTDAKVGLLRMVELMAGQFNSYFNNTTYWLLTSRSYSTVYYVGDRDVLNSVGSFYAYGVRPSMNLKENVVITSGDGTKNNPFRLELS